MSDGTLPPGWEDRERLDELVDSPAIGERIRAIVAELRSMHGDRVRARFTAEVPEVAHPRERPAPLTFTLTWSIGKSARDAPEE